jgi:hypothetical protein
MRSPCAIAIAFRAVAQPAEPETPAPILPLPMITVPAIGDVNRTQAAQSLWQCIES